MCFVLYAGTSKPIPLKDWIAEVPDLSVKALSEGELSIVAHFDSPHVQYIGSTSQCGCDFPNVTYQNGEWIWFESEHEDDFDRQRKATEQYNRESLVGLLRETGESIVELYGVWLGDHDFTEPPKNREEIFVDNVLRHDFRFKEQGFYSVRITHN